MSETEYNYFDVGVKIYLSESNVNTETDNRIKRILQIIHLSCNNTNMKCNFMKRRTILIHIRLKVKSQAEYKGI